MMDRPFPPLVIVASTLVPSPCPLESPPYMDIDLHYKSSLFLSFAFLPVISPILEYGVRFRQEGQEICLFKHISIYFHKMV